MRRPLEIGSLIAGYHMDKFGEVTCLERNGHRGNIIDKVHFIINSDFETWIINKNLSVYNAEGGGVNDRPGAGEKSFYESQPE